mgnify:CR=1 FL=1
MRFFLKMFVGILKLVKSELRVMLNLWARNCRVNADVCLPATLRARLLAACQPLRGVMPILYFIPHLWNNLAEFTPPYARRA